MHDQLKYIDNGRLIRIWRGRKWKSDSSDKWTPLSKTKPKLLAFVKTEIFKTYNRCFYDSLLLLLDNSDYRFSGHLLNIAYYLLQHHLLQILVIISDIHGSGGNNSGWKEQ